MSGYGYDGSQTGGGGWQHSGDWNYGGTWANETSSQWGGHGGAYAQSTGGSSSTIALENPYHIDPQYQNPVYDTGRPAGYPPPRSDTYHDANAPRTRGKIDDDDGSGVANPHFACLFHTICTARFYTQPEWEKHVDAHLPADRLPDNWPKAWQCRFPNCRHGVIQSHDAFTVWYRKLRHIAEHLEAGEDIKTLQEEFSYLTLFRDLNLVRGINNQFGVSTAQVWRAEPTLGRNQPDFRTAEEFDGFNERAAQEFARQRASEGNAQYPQAQNTRYALQRSQTLPVSYSNTSGGYNDAQYPPPLPSAAQGPGNPYYDQRPPFEHHPLSEPVPVTNQFPPTNYQYTNQYGYQA